MPCPEAWAGLRDHTGDGGESRDWPQRAVSPSLGPRGRPSTDESWNRREGSSHCEDAELHQRQGVRTGSRREEHPQALCLPPALSSSANASQWPKANRSQPGRELRRCCSGGLVSRGTEKTEKSRDRVLLGWERGTEDNQPACFPAWLCRQMAWLPRAFCRLLFFLTLK